MFQLDAQVTVGPLLIELPVRLRDVLGRCYRPISLGDDATDGNLSKVNALTRVLFIH